MSWSLTLGGSVYVADILTRNTASRRFAEHKSEKMLRITLFITFCLVASRSLACDKKIDPAIDCWNPSNQHVTEELNRFYDISEEIDEALFANELDRVRRLAEEYLRLAKKYHKNWNFGNATHDANIALGIVELRKNNITASASYLVAAGQSTGSPQLDSFGPDLRLANVLLKIGQNEAVIKYLEGVKTFWKMDGGRIDQWITAINEGLSPKLSRYSR